MEWSEIISNTLQAAVAVVLPVLITWIGKLVPMVFEWLQSKTNNEHLKQFAMVVEQITLAVNQTVIDGTKKAAADGKITEDEYKQILSDARKKAEDEAREHLRKLPSAIQELIGDKVGDWVEAAIAKIKFQGGAVHVNPSQPTA